MGAPPAVCRTFAPRLAQRWSSQIAAARCNSTWLARSRPPAPAIFIDPVTLQLQWGSSRGFATGIKGSKRFERVILPLLKVHYKREGHSEVPDGYTVTAEDLMAADLTSSDCRIGFRLGRSLRTIMTLGKFDIFSRLDRQAALDAIDCDWSGEQRFQRIFTVLQWFRATEGHMEVPQDCVMDEVQCREVGLPAHITEYRLGVTVDSIRTKGTFVRAADPSREAQCVANKEQLDNIGFIWNVPQHRFDHRVMPACIWFQSIKGHMEVRRDCVLDEAQCREAGLPKDITEFRLGDTVNNIRNKGHFVQTEDPSREVQYTANMEKLDNIGFIWDATQHRFDYRIVPACVWYEEANRHMMVPTKFVMDEAQCRDAGLPQHVTEFRLGEALMNIRHNGDFVETKDPSREMQCAANKAWLEEQGFMMKDTVEFQRARRVVHSDFLFTLTL